MIQTRDEWQSATWDERDQHIKEVHRHNRHIINLAFGLATLITMLTVVVTVATGNVLFWIGFVLALVTQEVVTRKAKRKYPSGEGWW